MQALPKEGLFSKTDLNITKDANFQPIDSSFSISIRPDNRASEPSTKTLSLKPESKEAINKKVAHQANVALNLERCCKARRDEECEQALSLIKSRLFSFAPGWMKSIKISISDFILIEIQSQLPKIYKNLPLREIKLTHEIKQLRGKVAIIHFFFTGIDYRILGNTHPLFFLTKEDFFITLVHIFDETIVKLKDALSEKDPYVEKFFLSNKGKELKAQVSRIIDQFTFLLGLIKKKSDSVMKILLSTPANLDDSLELEPKRTVTDWLNRAKSFLIHLKIAVKEVFPEEEEAILGISSAIKYVDHYLKKTIQPKDIKPLQTLIYNSTAHTVALCEEASEREREDRQKSEVLSSLNNLTRFQKMMHQIDVAKPNIYAFTLSGIESMNHALVMALEVLVRETKGGVEVKAKENFFLTISLILEKLKQEVLGDEIEDLRVIEMALRSYKKLKNEDVLYLYFGSLHLIEEMEVFIENLSFTRVQIFRKMLEEIQTREDKGARLTLDIFLYQLKTTEEFFESLTSLAASITYFRRKMLYLIEEKRDQEKPVKKKGKSKPAFKKKTRQRKGQKNPDAKEKKIEKKTSSQLSLTQNSLPLNEPIDEIKLEGECSLPIEKPSFEEEESGGESQEAIEKTLIAKKIELFQSDWQAKGGSKEPRSKRRGDDRENFRNVSSKELLKELIKAGWERKKSIGGHAQFVLPGRSDLGRVTVPINNKRDGLPIKTVQNVKNSIKMGESNN